jgi:hypothetical protein
MWTENWPGWFQKWGEPAPHRPATDVAFGVARWFARGGSFVSYYMAFGGSNFGRSVGGPQIVTSYDYDVQINEYGLRNEPKYSLLQQLHEIIRSNEKTLLDQMPPEPIAIDSTCEVHVYSEEASNCIAFLSNWNEKTDCVVNVDEGGVLIDSVVVNPWSVTIMKGNDCRSLDIIYNTKTSIADAEPENQLTGIPFEEVSFTLTSVKGEVIPSINVPIVTSPSALEQLSVTKDSTDYLWYSTQVSLILPCPHSLIPLQIESNSTSGSLSYLSGGAGGEVLYLFVNGKYETSTIEDRTRGLHATSSLEKTPVSLQFPVPLGTSQLDLLSVSMGLNNYGSHMEENQVGIVSSVKFNGVALTDFTHSIGLTGESLLASDVPHEILPCDSLCWFHLNFPTPLSYDPSPTGLSTIALDLGLSNLFKGVLYVNGHMIGRYCFSSPVLFLTLPPTFPMADIGPSLPATNSLSLIARSVKS